MRILRLILGFCGICVGLFLLDSSTPLWETTAAWMDEAVQITGARIYLRLDDITFTFNRGLIALLGEKWNAICTVSEALLPPGTADTAQAVMGKIITVLGH